MYRLFNVLCWLWNIYEGAEPSASCNSASGRPRHLGVIVLTTLQTGMKQLYTILRSKNFLIKIYVCLITDQVAMMEGSYIPDYGTRH